jgi:hypothetical protein
MDLLCSKIIRAKDFTCFFLFQIGTSQNFVVLPTIERRIYNREFIEVVYIELHYEVHFKEYGMGGKYNTL